MVVWATVETHSPSGNYYKACQSIQGSCIIMLLLLVGWNHAHAEKYISSVGGLE